MSEHLTDDQAAHVRLLLDTYGPRAIAEGLTDPWEIWERCSALHAEVLEWMHWKLHGDSYREPGFTRLIADRLYDAFDAAREARP